VIPTACGPTAGAQGTETTSDAPTSTTTFSSSGSPDTTSTADPSGGGVTSSAGAESTGAPTACADSVDVCPDGCEAVTAYAESDWECVEWGTERTVCIEPGRELDPNEPSAWWRVIDGAPLLLMVGHGCFDQLEHEPLDWAECSGADDEPAACRCLCHGGVCIGEDEAASCEPSLVCPPATPWAKFADPGMQCILEGLRDRVPGEYELRFWGPNDSTTFRLLVAADGTVQVLRDMLHLTGCPSALNGLWRPARHCTLASPDFFAGCLRDGFISFDCPTGDFTLDGWIVDCVDAPLVCF
jgi:hypothetical protein